MTIELTTSAPPRSAPSATGRPAASRSAGLDALRATMVLLVVFHHAAITYGAAGGWYYREVPTDGSLQTRLLILLCAVDQAYFMGLLFLLAGYFTPPSLARHGVLGYAKERLLRLGAPLVVFGLLIGPITIALAQTASNRPFLGTLLYVWGRGAFSPGPLWFAFALLIFSFVFVAWRTVQSRLNAEPPAFEPRPFPSNLILLVTALATGAAAFGLRLVWTVGTTITSDLQLGYFASYIVLFAAGCIGASSQWLDHIPSRQRRRWLAVAWVTVAFVFVGIVLQPGSGSAAPDNSLGGWHVAAAIYAFWEPLVAWGFIMGLVYAFQRRLRKLNVTWAALARRSYAIYIIHPPVLVGVALAWRDVPAPPLVKFAVTGAVACLFCFFAAGPLLRAPGLDKVL
jgi:peptidoglycan/LPS O-acetylase OafA/YrhL